MNKREAIINYTRQECRLKEVKLEIISINSSMKEYQAIIDAPEPKAGRVMDVDDLADEDTYFAASTQCTEICFDGRESDKARILHGLAFHDKESCQQYLIQLKREQELRSKR